VVKHGVIADARLFSWMEQNVAAILRRRPEAVSHMVRRSCEIKAAVVGEDERESGLRVILNFGHTVGHALESLSHYRGLRHGEAVALGMVAAARLACQVRGFGDESAGKIERLLSQLGLPTRLPQMPADAVLAAMTTDKKAVGGTPRLVLPTEIGHVEVVADVPVEAMRRALLSVGASD